MEYAHTFIYFQRDGHEFEQAPGVGDGPGSLACCNPWGHKESDMTEQLNWLTERERKTKNKFTLNFLKYLIRVRKYLIIVDCFD